MQIKQILLFLLICLQALSQTNTYIGTAVHSDIETARAQAYKNMIEQINVFISASSDIQTKETNAGISANAAFRTITMSSISLTDVREDVTKDDEGNYVVKKIVSKESVRKYYEQRRERIIQYLKAASKELDINNTDVRMGVVLKNLYKALLERALYPETLDYTFTLYSSKQFTATIPGIQDALRYTVEQIDFSPIRKIEDDNIVYQYSVTAFNKSVNDLQFNYYDGQGQTDADVINGKTKCTFYYQKRDYPEKGITAYIEYRFSDELSQELAMADGMLSGLQINNGIQFILPGKNGIVSTTNSPLPPQITELIATSNNFEELTKVLKNLQKRSKIIIGAESDFGSLEGLYGLIPSRNGIEVLFKVEKGKCIDVRTGKEITLDTFAGKPLTYIEVLK